jgi:hypothetical protein
MAKKVELRKRLAAKKEPPSSPFFVILPAMSKMIFSTLCEHATAVMGDAARFIDSYQWVSNPREQWDCNLRVTGEVVIHLTTGKRVTVALRDFWPCWRWSDDKMTRQFIKHDYLSHLQKVAAGNINHPMENLLEWLAYSAIMIVKAREAAPREGNICGNVNRLLEVAGHVVESVTINGVTYTRETVQTKIDRLQRYVDSAVANGQYQIKRGKKQGAGMGESWG